ncbi:unnamed protein product [Pseudo-nitzschia multistriata]|uniref:Calcineurin-like phosphoesterase domain-containing protein n=1 Tax=Pseudo-nitzschia multistriata TaxID=183589 RepID=A0A448ZNM1_9STRA|nr:unnamed protein product [Pseudo-nitzschia multistriata]
MANRTTAKASVHHCKRRLLRLAMVLPLLCCFGSRAVRSWTATRRSPGRRPFATPLPFQSGGGALCAFSPPCARETPVHRLPEVRRVFCISDLHVDHPSNMEWLQAWSKGRARSDGNNNDERTDDEKAAAAAGPRTTDLLVVAGDISHDPGKIEEALLLLRNHTEHVVFVPGNHEAWLSSSDELKAYDEHQTEGAEKDAGNPCCGETQTQPKPARYSSIEKLEDIERLCRRLGVFTTGDCVCVGGGALESEDGKLLPAEELWILPMDGWYDGSLSFVDPNPSSGSNGNGTSSSNHHYDLVSDFGRWPWVDFLRCRWPGLESVGENDENEPPPPPLLRKIPRGLVGHFVKRNQGTIDAFKRATTERESFKRGSKPPPTKSAFASVLTVSHFLPNRLCLPDWKDLSSADFDFDSWLDHGAGGLSAKFALVAGSDKLDQQIRSIPLPQYNDDENSEDDSDANDPSSSPRRIHVFGHSHRPKDFVYGGIRYVHNPLGKPRERELHMVDPEAAPKLVWEAIPSEGEGEGEGSGFSSKRAPQGCHTASSTTTIIRYWEEKGGGLEMLRKRMEGSKRRRRKGPKN